MRFVMRYVWVSDFIGWISLAWLALLLIRDRSLVQKEPGIVDAVCLKHPVVLRRVDGGFNEMIPSEMKVTCCENFVSFSFLKGAYLKNK